MEAFSKNAMISCSIRSHPTINEEKTEEGLVRGHSYSMTKAVNVDIVTEKISGVIPLVRLRNPWGDEQEWKGAFSDDSIEWQCIPEETKEKIKLNFAADGEFWMTFGHFKEHFDILEICRLPPNCSLDDNEINQNWNLNILEGKWVKGNSAGGCSNNLETYHRNPQYIMKIAGQDIGDDKKCTVIVSLMQKSSRLRNSLGLDLLSIGFSIYGMSKNDLAQKPQKREFFEYQNPTAKTEKFQNFREVNGRFQLSAGDYLVVPSTFHPNEENDFVIRIFTENSNIFEENDQSVELKQRVYNENTVSFYFSIIPKHII